MMLRNFFSFFHFKMVKRKTIFALIAIFFCCLHYVIVNDNFFSLLFNRFFEIKKRRGRRRRSSFAYDHIFFVVVRLFFLSLNKLSWKLSKPHVCAFNSIINRFSTSICSTPLATHSTLKKKTVFDGNKNFVLTKSTDEQVPIEFHE